MTQEVKGELLTARRKWNRGGAGPQRPRSRRVADTELRGAGADGARTAAPEVAREGKVRSRAGPAALKGPTLPAGPGPQASDR